MKLLTPTEYSHKTELGLASGIGQAILYLDPASVAGGHNMCPGHSPECLSNCLIYSGQMIMPNAVAARKWRTLLLQQDPEQFGRLLQRDVDAHLRWVRKRGLLPAVRFNGTSDYHWEEWEVPHLGETIHQYLLRVSPETVINEYTKRYSFMKRYLEGAYTPNLYATFSLHERNELQAMDVLRRGGNVTVVFKAKVGQPLPSSWWGRPVLDGDVDDLRWMDRGRAHAMGLDASRGLVIGLRAKGKAARTDTPFVIDPHRQALALPIAA